MTTKKRTFNSIAVLALILNSCNAEVTKNHNLERAEETLNAIYKYYSVENSHLLRETYPFDKNHKATYLANDEQANQKKPYSYLWPYSGSLSAVNALYEAASSKKYLEMFDNKVLPGLEQYYDTRRSPDAYASYITTAPLSDRFYDDNVWIGIDFTDMYLQTKNPFYLEKAKTIWKFIESGMDSVRGGIYWNEQKKSSKHTCSSAPATVYAVKLFEATNDETFLTKAKTLYEWTKTNLQDPEDHLYYDNINPNRIDKRKYSYNSGQMMQAATLLYKHTHDANYLTDAQNIAKSSYQHFFHEFETESGEKFRLLNRRDVWFTAIMFRGFIELYAQDNNREYIDAFQKNLDYAWTHMREEYGLFDEDWSGEVKNDSKWLLTQFAMVEMYARMSEL